MITPRFILLIAASVVASSAQADSHRSPSVDAEIQHLRTFVKNSTCTFNRNGDVHAGPRALEHIDRKADHFDDDIDTAEEFIDLSASRSLISRKDYRVTCNNVEATSNAWLNEELNRYRSTQ
jgi:hypothetical protein